MNTIYEAIKKQATGRGKASCARHWIKRQVKMGRTLPSGFLRTIEANQLNKST